jgi:hypothetical protein
MRLQEVMTRAPMGMWLPPAKSSSMLLVWEC